MPDTRSVNEIIARIDERLDALERSHIHMGEQVAIAKMQIASVEGQLTESTTILGFTRKEVAGLADRIVQNGNA